MSTPRISGRRSAILPTLIIAAVLVVAFAIFTSFWTDRLWYTSLDFGTVFTTMLLTRIGLFVAFGLLMAVLVGGNAVLAYRLRSKTRLGPPTSPLLERYRELLDARLVWVVLAVALLVGLFAGGAAAGQVDTFLAWRHQTPFNVTDPKFGLDIGFFVFAYPWWRFVASFAFTALVFSAIIAGVVHYITGGLRFTGPMRGGSARGPGPAVDPGGSGGADQRRQLLVRHVRPGDRQHHPGRGHLHRHQLHRRQRDRERQADPRR